MKKLLVSIALALTTQFATAAEEASTTPGRSGYAVLRGGGNLYRPIPRNDASNSARGQRIVYAKPTQHYYTKNNVVSYGYVEEARTRGASGGSYEGPRGAIFQPGNDFNDRNSSSLRNFASVNHRPQPGVPMVPKRSTTEDVRPGKKKRGGADPDAADR